MRAAVGLCRRERQGSIADMNLPQQWKTERERERGTERGRGRGREKERERGAGRQREIEWRQVETDG